MNDLIPTLSLADFLSRGSRRKTFLAALDNAFKTTGFFFLTDHGIRTSTLNKAREVFDLFFHTLTEEERRVYEFPDEQHQRGYTPMRLEKGEFAARADEKHFFQIGEDRNVPVSSIPEFNSATRELFEEFRTCSLYLLSAISESLNLRQQFEYLPLREGNSIMRAIDYPPTDNPLQDEGEITEGGNILGMCADKHTDINMITLLEAREEGLQLFYNCIWIPITITDPNSIIVNAGDMLQHLTGGMYRSGLHKVVCQKNTPRFSIPYFCHLKLNEPIVPLRHLGFEPDLEKYRFKTVGEYLHFRLEQIGL